MSEWDNEKIRKIETALWAEWRHEEPEKNSVCTKCGQVLSSMCWSADIVKRVSKYALERNIIDNVDGLNHYDYNYRRSGDAETTPLTHLGLLCTLCYMDRDKGKETRYDDSGTIKTEEIIHEEIEFVAEVPWFSRWT